MNKDHYIKSYKGEANQCLKKLSFDHLGNPGSFVGNPGSARVCPCLAKGLGLRHAGVRL